MGKFALGAALCLAALVQAQPRLEFEAASVKAVPEAVGWPPRAGYWVEPRAINPQRFRALIYASSLIEWAYGVRNFQVLGGPEWMREAKIRFEVQATAAEPCSVDEMRHMLRALLADRFGLKVHRESREIPAYALLVGKNGSKLTEATDTSKGGAIHIGNGMIKATSTTMEVLVGIMTENLERPVVDRTNLTGQYDFSLHFDPGSLPDWRLGPALFGLVQDIGLRLEAQKIRFEMVMVDSVERPTEN